MFAKLHVVRMKDFLCFSNEMHFVEFILSNARVLQVLSVRLGPDALCSNEEAVTAIKECPKASPDVQVIFLGSESTNTGPIHTSTENAKMGDVETTGEEHDSIDTPAENVEVEETQTNGKRGSVSTSTENAKMGEVKTTGEEHGSIDTPAENVEVEETQTEDGKCGSVSTSTENDEVEETQTTGSGCMPINTSIENAKVDGTQTIGSEHESTDMSTENAEVEETQTGETAGSGLVNDVHPQRRQRLDLESAAQLDQLEMDMQVVQENMQMHLEGRRLQLESRTQVLNFIIHYLKYQPRLKELSEHTNTSLPPFPEPSPVLSSLLATSRTGSVNLGVNGAASVHLDSSENHGLNGADNAHTDS